MYVMAVLQISLGFLKCVCVFFFKSIRCFSGIFSQVDNRSKAEWLNVSSIHSVTVEMKRRPCNHDDHVTKRQSYHQYRLYIYTPCQSSVVTYDLSDVRAAVSAPQDRKHYTALMTAVPQANSINSMTTQQSEANNECFVMWQSRATLL